jgi:hypothetical protein
MEIVPVLLDLIEGISSIRIYIPMVSTGSKRTGKERLEGDQKGGMPATRRSRRNWW